VHLGAQVRGHGGGRVGEAGVRLHEPALLGHEHAARGRHLDVHRTLEAGEHGRLLEARGQGHRTGGARRDQRGQAYECDDEDST
jgi:hypothetical protein